MSDFIKAEGLGYSYEDSDKPALRYVDFSVKKGEYTAILGHNGSGKSTLAKLLNLILLPSSGKLTIDGKTITADISDDEVFDIRRKIGMVFQNPDNQLVATVVEEDVAFGPENLGVPPEEIRARVADALKKVGMTAYAAHSPAYLSGGQKQRVALAGVIAMRPACIIFDESTSMLDPVGRREVMACMDELHEKMGMTIIHITHYMEEAARADRIFVMNDGDILFSGTPREVFSREEKLYAVGLGVPQGTALLSALRRAGCDLPAGLTAVDDCVAAIDGLLKKGGLSYGG